MATQPIYVIPPFHPLKRKLKPIKLKTSFSSLMHNPVLGIDIMQQVKYSPSVEMEAVQAKI